MRKWKLVGKIKKILKIKLDFSVKKVKMSKEVKISIRVKNKCQHSAPPVVASEDRGATPSEARAF